jgi:hypothetical protein
VDDLAPAAGVWAFATTWSVNDRVRLLDFTGFDSFPERAARICRNGFMRELFPKQG